MVMVATDKPPKDWPTAEAAYLLAKQSIPDLEFVRVKDLSHGEALTEIRKADIFMLTSTREGGNPIALMEAMSMGKACVVSRVGGIRDIIEGGKNGLFATPGFPDEFAKGIVYLSNNPDMRKQLGDAAQSTAFAHSWLRTALEYEGIFRSI